MEPSIRDKLVALYEHMLPCPVCKYKDVCTGGLVAVPGGPEFPRCIEDSLESVVDVALLDAQYANRGK